MSRRCRFAPVLVLAASLVAALNLPLAAQQPNDPPPTVDPARGGRRGNLPPNAPRGGPPLAAAVNNEQVYELLDAFVLGRAQAALLLNDQQFFAFFQRMKALQALQRTHRRARQRVLVELRQISGPNVPNPGDDAAIAAKTKELDDLEARNAADEQKALDDIDQVLQVRQRAMLRLFLDSMERQKLDLLLKARQGVPPPGGGRQ